MQWCIARNTVQLQLNKITVRLRQRMYLITVRKTQLAWTKIINLSYLDPTL